MTDEKIHAKEKLTIALLAMVACNIGFSFVIAWGSNEGKAVSTMMLFIIGIIACIASILIAGSVDRDDR